MVDNFIGINRLRAKRLKRIWTHGSFAFYSWRKKKYSPPSPYRIKKIVLNSNAFPNAPWIETGTYLGETTKFLSKRFPKIVSLEPSLSHFKYVSKRFKKNTKIQIINKTSEEGFEETINNFSGALNIYLDGHASGDGTFTGINRTPIIHELSVIEKYLFKFDNIFIAIDDVRVFGSVDNVYPSNFYLVNWCKKNNLTWKIEHDIFLAQKIL